MTTTFSTTRSSTPGRCATGAPGDESGHDHFFATFDKFELTADNHVAEAVATVINRAAREHVQYVEFMHTADGGAAAKLGMQLGWDSQTSPKCATSYWPAA